MFRDLDLHVGPRDKLALIGRNGAGKTTLLRLITNEIEADKGKRVIQPGVNIVMLEQEPDFTPFATLRDFAVAGARGPALHEVEAIADQLGTNLSTRADKASGGEKRRAALCRALASEPDLLLLDEPTNHLDLGAIDWLEEWLGRYKGAFITISHDRTFLTRLTKQTFWLERGVTARRKRNQGRLEKLWEMRAQRAAMIGPAGAAKLQAESDDSRTKSVITATDISKSFGEGDAKRTIIQNFSLRVQRGDRIGIVGANGAGKTTPRH